MKILFFGVNGYLGRHLYSTLSKVHNVIPFSKNSNSIDQLSNYRSIDIANRDELNDIDFDVEFVFLFSGITGTLNGFENYKDFINVNEIGLLNVLDRIKNLSKKPRIIFPSTRLVYKGKKNRMLKEDDYKEPKTIYAQNKLACENYLRMYFDLFGIEYTIYRICVPFGNLLDSEYSFGTIGYFMSRARNGQDISLYGDGSLKRTFTHIKSFSEKILHSFSLPETVNNVFNIGGLNLSLDEVARKVADHFSVNVAYVDWPNNALKIESGDTMFDSSRIDELTPNINYLNFDILFN